MAAASGGSGPRRDGRIDRREPHDPTARARDPQPRPIGDIAENVVADILLASISNHAPLIADAGAGEHHLEAVNAAVRGLRRLFDIEAGP